MSEEEVFSYSKALRDLINSRSNTTAQGQSDKDRAAKCAEQIRKFEMQRQAQEGGGDGGKSQRGCVFQHIHVEEPKAFSSIGVDDKSGTVLESDVTAYTGGGKKQAAKFEKPFEISIPLRGGDRVDINEMKRTLKTEYAARYCEALGIAPTPQNMAAINKKLPLDKCRIRQVFHPGLGRGERRNHIAIQPHVDEVPRRGVKVEQESDTPFELLPEEPAAVTAKPKVAVTDDMAHVPSQPTFEHYKKRFVYPYNLKERFELETESVHSKATEDEFVPKKRKQLRATVPTPQGGSGQMFPPLSAEARLKMHDAMAKKLAQGQSDIDPILKELGEHREITNQHVSKLERMLKKNQEGSDSDEEGGGVEMGGGDAEGEGFVGQLGLDEMVELMNRRKSDPQKGHTPISSSRGGALHKTPPPPPQRKSSFFSGREVADATIQKELDQQYVDFEALEISPLQQQFVADFPFDKYEHHDRESIKKAKVFLQSNAVTEAALLLLTFQFVAYIAPLSRVHSSSLSVAQKDTAFVELYSKLIPLLHRRATSSKGVLPIEVPLLILCLRVITDTQFSTRYPAFCQCPMGVQVMRKMDALSMVMLDPMGYMSHLPAIEATPQALRVLHTKRLPRRVPPSVTSPLTTFVLGDQVLSTEARTLAKPHPIVCQGLKELKEHVTPMVRAKLLALMAERSL